MKLYVGSVQYVVSILFASLCYFLITRLIFFLIFFSCVFSCFVSLFSVCIALCIVSLVVHKYLYKFTDHSHWVETLISYPFYPFSCPLIPIFVMCLMSSC